MPNFEVKLLLRQSQTQTDGSGNPHTPKTTKMVKVFNCNLGSVRYMNINIAFSFHLHKVMDCVHGDVERINNRVHYYSRTYNQNNNFI